MEKLSQNAGDHIESTQESDYAQPRIFYLFERAILYPNAHTNTEIEENHSDEHRIEYRDTTERQE